MFKTEFSIDLNNFKLKLEDSPMNVYMICYSLISYFCYFKVFLLRYQKFLRTFLQKDSFFDEKNVITQLNNLKTYDSGLIELKIDLLQINLSLQFLIFLIYFGNRKD